MSSRLVKKITSVLAASFLGASLVGCSYFFKETPKTKKTIEVGAAAGAKGCLSRSVDVLKDYLDGRAAASETDTAFDCAARSIDMFSKNIEGEQTGVYTKGELKAFIEKYFLDGKAIDPEVLPMAFRLKSSLFGGSEESLTREEISRIRAFVLSLKGAARRLEPYADLYSFKADGKLARSDESRFDKGMEALAEVVDELSQAFVGADRKDFALKDLEVLLKQASKDKDLTRYAGLALAAKQILVQPPADRVRGGEWRSLFHAGARVYSFYLRYKRYLQDASIFAPQDFSHIEKLARQSLDLVERGLSARAPGGAIEASEIQTLVRELARADLVPDDIRPTSLEELIWPVTARFLRDPKLPPKKRDVPGSLGSGEVQRLRADLEGWIAGHHLILKVAPEDRLYSASELVSGFAKVELETSVQNPLGLAVVRPARAELHEVLSKGRLLAWDEEGRLKVVRREDSPGMTRKDLLTMNGIRAAVQLVLRGYAADIDRATGLKGITENELQEFYMDVRPIGVDLDILDARNTTSGSRSFMEANVFTSVAADGTLVSRHEGIEFFHYVFSGGKLAKRIHAGAVRECGTDELDISNHRRLEPMCFRAHMRENFARYFANLPGIVEFTKSFGNDRAKWDEFLFTLEDASRPGGVRDEKFEFHDIRTMSPIVHYTESLFVNFDDDRSGVFESEEIWRAFPNFRDFIRKLGQGKAEAESIQKTIFSFLIVFGRPPAPGKAGMAEVAGWWVGHRVWDETATRIDAVRIISTIAVHSRQTKFGKIKTFFDANAAKLPNDLVAGDETTTKELTRLFLCPTDKHLEVARLVKERAPHLLAPPEAEEIRLEACGPKVRPLPDCSPKASSPLTARIFAERLNSSIRKDPVLSRVCSAIF